MTGKVKGNVPDVPDVSVKRDFFLSLRWQAGCY